MNEEEEKRIDASVQEQGPQGRVIADHRGEE